MDNKGFIFTVDAALMLIPIFIIIAAVSHVNLAVPNEAPYYNTQDVMDTIYSTQNGNLISIANVITSTGTISSTNNNLTDLKSILLSYHTNYEFDYSKNNGTTFISLINSGNRVNANGIVSSATRTYGNVIFRLYMWKS